MQSNNDYISIIVPILFGCGYVIYKVSQPAFKIIEQFGIKVYNVPDEYYLTNMHRYTILK